MIKYEKNCVKDIKIAYIGGGSRGWAWGFMSDLSLEESISGTVFLYDIDLPSAKANEIIGNKAARMEEARSQWNYVVSEDIDSALEGADFVIISITPGTILSFKEMRSDVHTPEKYGIYQSVGDTVGPGGLFRAMRVLPMYEGFADKIREHCPDAWVINYTNPMTLCTRILYERFPQIKAFGCCHEVFGTQKILAYALKEFCGITVDRRMIKTNVLGLNHFTWIDRAEYQGRDLFQLYEKLVEKYGETGLEGVEKNHWANKEFTSGNKVKFDLFKRYGLIAAAGDRHLAEFCPPWYLKNPEVVASWGFMLTTVDKREQMLEERLKRSRALVSGEEAFKFQVTGEDGVYQIKALLGLEDFMCNVNLPNTGQIQGLPKGAVVESNAFFTRNRIIPVQAGRLPDPVNILVLRHVINQEMILKACVDRDYHQAFQAFCNDPLMTLDVRTAKTLFCEMIDHTKEFLPDYRW